MFSKLKTYSAVRMWLNSLSYFVGGTLAAAIFDYVGVRWLNIDWPGGPNIFPNKILGIPLVLIQLVAVGFLVAAGIKLYTEYKGVKGFVFGVALVLCTGICYFLFYFIFPYWYQIDLMGRTI